jgi:hypothetical protein
LSGVISPKWSDYQNNGVAPPQLLITLLWHEQNDLDLYFYCSGTSGDRIGYNVENTCGAVDLDNTASHYTAVRGDGSEGQTENISVGTAVDGQTYNGYVHYYSSSGPSTPFRIIATKPHTDGNGNWDGTLDVID